MESYIKQCINKRTTWIVSSSNDAAVDIMEDSSFVPSFTMIESCCTKVIIRMDGLVLSSSFRFDTLTRPSIDTAVIFQLAEYSSAAFGGLQCPICGE